MSDFVGPELRVGFWDGVELASLVAVPEAAVDENGGAVSRQDDVGRSGEGADILAEAESAMEQFPADHNFRARVLRPDVRHTFVPLLLCHCVCHCKSRISTQLNIPWMLLMK